MRRHKIPGVARVSTTDPSLASALQRAELLTNHHTTVPDQKNLLLHMGQLFQVTTLPALADILHYTGPLEEMSLWLCLFAADVLCSSNAWKLLSSRRARLLACPNQSFCCPRATLIAWGALQACLFLVEALFWCLQVRLCSPPWCGAASCDSSAYHEPASCAYRTG